MKRQASPILVPDGEDMPSVLERCDFRDTSLYDEAWIQALIHERPMLLPLWELEPAMHQAVPVCRELPLPSGSLDNLLVTPNGDLVLVECKLWRNPQARREVVAQVIDYAKDLKRLDYAALDAAVREARGDAQTSLYELIDSELEEADFVDAVSLNLRRGRALLVVAGDGITESVEHIADYLQQHAGMHFTLALVQLAVYELPAVGKLVVPSIPLRTTNVVRGIVTVEDGATTVTAPPDTPRTRRATNLTEEEFFGILDGMMPGTSDRILALVQKGQDLGLYIDVKKALRIRMPLGEDDADLLVVRDNAEADVAWVWGVRHLAGQQNIRRYLEDLANAIDGALVRQTPKSPYVKLPDRYLTVWDVLDNGDAWLAAVERLRDAVLEKAEA